jgi:replicative DNA helicase
MITSENIETYIINSIIKEKEGFEDIFLTFTENDFSNKHLKNIFIYLKSQFENNDELKIELYSVQYNLSKVISKIVSLENEYKIQYLIELFQEVVSNRIILNETTNLSNNQINVANKKQILENLSQTISEKFLKSDLSSSDKSISSYRKYIDKVKLLDIDNTGIIGLSSSVLSLDYMIKGLKKGDYILLAGRPSMGKTSLALGMFLEAIMADDDSIPIMFSLETEKEHIMARLISLLNNDIPLSAVLYGENIEKYQTMIDEALELLSSKKFYIEDFINGHLKNIITMTDIEQKIFQIHKETKKNINLVVIDHIGLLSSDSLNKKYKDQKDIISEISRQIKILTKKYSTPFIALSQLNRELEKRQDKRPIMSDLRESGALEQDADIIIFVYRAAVYLERELKELLKKKPDDQNLLRELNILKTQLTQAVELIVSKQRNGPIGIVDAEFLKSNSKFGNTNSFEENVFDELENSLDSVLYGN